MSKIKHIRKRIYISTALCLAVGVIGGFIMWSISNFHTAAPHKSASEESPSLPAENVDDFLMSEEEKKKWDKTIDVYVKDYVTDQPIADIDIAIREIQACIACMGCTRCFPEHPLELFATTNGEGFAQFTVPFIGFHVQKFTVPGYLPYPLDWDLWSAPTIRLLEENRNDGKKTLTISLIPESMLVIKTEQEAIAAVREEREVQEWLQSHPDAKLDTQKLNESKWQVRYSIKGGGSCDYLVRTIDGAIDSNGGCLQ